MTATTHDDPTHVGGPTSGHHESPDVVGARQRLGVILLILADVAFVLSLVFAHLYLRQLNTEGGWIPKDGGTESVGFGWVIAAVMVAGWAAYRWGERGARAGRKARLVVGTGLAVLVAVVDLALQVYQMAASTLRAADGAYASSFMALSGYHAFHVLLTVFIGVGVWNRARLGRYAGNDWQVRIVGYWWAWVAVSAVITAATLSFTTSPHVVP
jgi:heme/copper-type cytochrome/quinol oxidase subunit 3